MDVLLSASSTLVAEVVHPLKLISKLEAIRSLVLRKSKELLTVTMDQLIAPTHKPSVTAQARNSALETVWEEVPVLITNANADQDTQE